MVLLQLVLTVYWTPRSQFSHFQYQKSEAEVSRILRAPRLGRA